MHGTITFNTISDLADFLREFTPSTALFTVTQRGNVWVLQFTGGC